MTLGPLKDLNRPRDAARVVMPQMFDQAVDHRRPSFDGSGGELGLPCVGFEACPKHYWGNLGNCFEQHLLACAALAPRRPRELALDMYGGARDQIDAGDVVARPGPLDPQLRVSRDREHGFQCIVSDYFAGS